MGYRGDRLRKFADEEQESAKQARELGFDNLADSEERMAKSYRAVADELDEQEDRSERYR